MLSPEAFRTALKQEARIAVRCVLESAMQEELTFLLQADRHERTPGRTGKRNGGYLRELITGLGPLTLQVPRDREGQYQTRVFDPSALLRDRRFARRPFGKAQGPQTEVTQLLTGMFVGGVSQSQVGHVVESLLGTAPIASTVSRTALRRGSGTAHDLQAACDTWRKRPLQAQYRVIYLDGVYFSICHEDQVDSTPLLVALGVDLTGHKEVLGFVVAGQESAPAWQGLLDDLKQRGVQKADLFVTDGAVPELCRRDEGLIGVLERAFPESKRQRCITHKMRNVLAKVPQRAKKEVAACLKGVFAQPSRPEAQTHLDAFCARYQTVYPEAVTTLRRDVDSCLTFYDFPREMWSLSIVEGWKHIRTTNALEGLFHTVRLRTDKIGAFRNEASCVLIVYAVLQTVQLRRISV